MGPLSNLDRPALQIDAAVGRDPHTGLGRFVHAAGILEPNGKPHAPAVFALAISVSDTFRDKFHTGAQIGVERAFAGHVFLAQILQVLHAQIHRVPGPAHGR